MLFAVQRSALSGFTYDLAAADGTVIGELCFPDWAQARNARLNNPAPGRLRSSIDLRLSGAAYTIEFEVTRRGWNNDTRFELMQNGARLASAEAVWKIGIDGKARVCARGAVALSDNTWLAKQSDHTYPGDAMAHLRRVQQDHSLPVSVRDAAERHRPCSGAAWSGELRKLRAQVDVVEHQHREGEEDGAQKTNDGADHDEGARLGERHGGAGDGRETEEKQEVPEAGWAPAGAGEEAAHDVGVDPADGIDGAEPGVGEEGGGDQQEQGAAEKAPAQGEELALHGSSRIG